MHKNYVIDFNAIAADFTDLDRENKTKVLQILSPDGKLFNSTFCSGQFRYNVDKFWAFNKDTDKKGGILSFVQWLKNVDTYNSAALLKRTIKEVLA